MEIGPVERLPDVDTVHHPYGGLEYTPREVILGDDLARPPRSRASTSGPIGAQPTCRTTMPIEALLSSSPCATEPLGPRRCCRGTGPIPMTPLRCRACGSDQHDGRCRRCRYRVALHCWASGAAYKKADRVTQEETRLACIRSCFRATPLSLSQKRWTRREKRHHTARSPGP